MNLERKQFLFIRKLAEGDFCRKHCFCSVSFADTDV